MNVSDRLVAVIRSWHSDDCNRTVLGHSASRVPVAVAVLRMASLPHWHATSRLVHCIFNHIFVWYMKSIGIRVSPSKITFVVFDKDSQSIVNVEALRIPIAFETPDALKYVRSNLLDILREYEVSYAGVRVTEPNAQSMNISRIQLEGVIQEAFASSQLKGYYVGQISSISARLGIPRTDFKLYVQGTKSWNVEGWGSLDVEAREAMLCAIGAVA